MLVTTVGTRLVVFVVSGQAPVELGSVPIERLVQRIATEFGVICLCPAQLLRDGVRVVDFVSRVHPWVGSGKES